MADSNEPVRLSLTVSPELNQLLERLAVAGHMTKSDVLRRAIALYDLAYAAKLNKNHIGFFDQDRTLVTEIVGF